MSSEPRDPDLGPGEQSFDELRLGFREALAADEMQRARLLADAAAEKFPNELVSYELQDCWYYCNSELEDEERHRGRLRAIEKMIELNPSDRDDVFDQADYESGLYFERAHILVQLAELSAEAGVLKEAMDAFDKCIEMRGNDFWISNERRAAFELVVDDLDEERARTVFGDIPSLRLRYIDEWIENDEFNAVEARSHKANYLVELGRHTEAIEVYRSVLSQKNDSYLSHLAIAKCHIELGEFKEALDACASIPVGYQYALDRKLVEARALARLSRHGEAIDKLRDYGIEDKGVGVKGTVRAHRDFIDLWDHPDFLELTFASNLSLEAVESMRDEVRKTLAMAD